MELAAKAAVIAICASLITLLIKRTNPELSLLLAVCVSTALAIMALRVYAEVQETLELARLDTSVSSAYTKPVLKCVGIGVVSRLGADLCKDAGQAAAASSVELCGAVCAVLAALPLLKTFFQMIGELA